MKWGKVMEKAGLGALLAGGAALVPLVLEAERLSTIDWDRAGASVVAAGLGALVAGGQNWLKHRGT